MSADMRPGSVTVRLRQVSTASNLRPERRLDSKLALSPSALTRRLRQVSELRDLCHKLGQAGRGAGEKRGVTG